MLNNIIKITLLLLIIISGTLIFNSMVIADSGFDASYDSGGSYSSDSSSYSSSGSYSSSSYDHDWSSSSSSSYSSSGNYRYQYNYSFESFVKFLYEYLTDIFGSALVAIIVDILFFFFVFLLFVKVLLKNANEIRQEGNLYQKEYSERQDKVNKYRTEEMLSKLGNDFDVDMFYEKAYDIYVKIQTAWMNRDIEPVRKYLSDTIYNTYKNQLEQLKMKKEINVMDKFNYIDASIVDVNRADKYVEIKMQLNVNCFDYMVNEETKRIIRGSNWSYHNYLYELTFIVNLDRTDITTCPKCGAEIEDSSYSTCIYCRSEIVRDIGDFILINKKMLNQYVERHEEHEWKK